MDDTAKTVLAGWIRHFIGFAAGAMGLETWLNPDLVTGMVTLGLALVALVWSTVQKQFNTK